MVNPKRGFPGLRCPLCGEGYALVVNVEDARLDCGNCCRPVPRHAVESMLEGWRKLLDWIDRPELPLRVLDDPSPDPSRPAACNGRNGRDRAR